jgi:hypothetical protein
MALDIPPDAIFELFLPFQPSTDETNELVDLVQSGLPVQKSEHVWSPNISALSIGFWIAKDGFTDDQLQNSLRAASFISSDAGATADLFFSTALIKLLAAQAWADPQVKKRIPVLIGDITLNDNINVDVSSAGIVTTIGGSYNPKVLPSVDFTYTITDSLTIDQSGALKANESTDLHLSALGIIEESVLIGLLNQFLGGVTFFGGILAGGLADPHEAGVGAQLAARWPSPKGILTPTSPPLTGKVIFTWSKLNVDTSGLSTLGTWNLAVRSPQVRISGATAVSFPNTNPSASAIYRVGDFSDLVGDGATVVWGGEAEGGGFSTTVEFDRVGVFSIQARVTDVDNVSASAATLVTVTETKGRGHPL